MLSYVFFAFPPAKIRVSLQSVDVMPDQGLAKGAWVPVLSTAYLGCCCGSGFVWVSRLVIAVVSICLPLAEGLNSLELIGTVTEFRGTDAHCGIMGQQLLSRNSFPALEALSVFWLLWEGRFTGYDWGGCRGLFGPLSL